MFKRVTAVLARPALTILGVVLLVFGFTPPAHAVGAPTARCNPDGQITITWAAVDLGFANSGGKIHVDPGADGVDVIVQAFTPVWRGPFHATVPADRTVEWWMSNDNSDGWGLTPGSRSEIIAPCPQPQPTTTSTSAPTTVIDPAPSTSSTVPETTSTVQTAPPPVPTTTAETTTTLFVPTSTVATTRPDDSSAPPPVLPETGVSTVLVPIGAGALVVGFVMLWVRTPRRR